MHAPVHRWGDCSCAAEAAAHLMLEKNHVCHDRFIIQWQLSQSTAEWLFMENIWNTKNKLQNNYWISWKTLYAGTWGFMGWEVSGHRSCSRLYELANSSGSSNFESVKNFLLSFLVLPVLYILLNLLLKHLSTVQQHLLQKLNFINVR